MMRTERRHVPRMTVIGHAYVNLDPNNGGVVLNISEGGLCFQSTASIQRTETIRLWFSYRSHPIEVDGGLTSAKGVSRFIEAGSELAWTDPTGKTGGLRFTNLPAEAREQIRNWIRQASLVALNEMAALSPPKPRFFGVKQLTSAARRASERVEARFRNIRSGRLWTGFSGGLLAGVLVSALMVAAFSLLTHSRELGDTFIRLGERLGGKSWTPPISSQPQASSQEPRSSSTVPAAPESSTPSPEPEPQPLTPKSQDILREPQRVEEASIQAPLKEKLVSTAGLTAPKSDGGELEAASPASASLSVPIVKPSDTPALSSTTGRPLTPGIGVAPASGPSTSMLRSSALEKELAIRPAVHFEPSKVEGIVMRSEKYLDVGRFKEKLLADKTTVKLSELGFPATVIQWNRFWGKSYQVLVGPYGGDSESEAAHRDLASLGFTPRSYERGRRDFRLPPALKVAAKQLPAGECVISWESYTPDAIVKFQDDKGSRTVTVEGKWVKQGVRYSENEVGYQTNRDGSHTLIEIHFAGMGQALFLSTH